LLSVSVGEPLLDGIGLIDGIPVMVRVSVGEQLRVAIGDTVGLGVLLSVSLGEPLRDRIGLAVGFGVMLTVLLGERLRVSVGVRLAVSLGERLRGRIGLTVALRETQTGGINTPALASEQSKVAKAYAPGRSNLSNRHLLKVNPDVETKEVAVLLRIRLSDIETALTSRRLPPVHVFDRMTMQRMD
jgi:hypothetical protein